MMKGTIKRYISLLMVLLLSGGVYAQSPKLVLLDGTPIKLRTAENLSSHDDTKGEDVSFEVVEDVFVDDVLLVKKGSVAIGTVTEAQHKRSMGRGGKLDITIDYVRLVDTEKAQLRGTREGKGGGHTGAMTGAMVATALVVWPVAPLFLFMHGKDIDIAKGTPVTAFVDGDFTIDPRAWQRYVSPQPAYVPAVATSTAPTTPTTNARAVIESGETAQGAQERATRNTVVFSQSGEESLGDAARRAKQHTDCLKLAENNPSVTCK
ncbi:MAG: PEGA domain-containing protein [Terriglobales bacterium]